MRFEVVRVKIGGFRDERALRVGLLRICFMRIMGEKLMLKLNYYVSIER